MSSTATEQSTFTRPSFIASGVVVALIVVVGTVLGIGALTDNDGTTPPPAVAAPEPGPSSSPESETDAEELPGGASVCGLEGVETSGSVIAAPAVEWDLVGTTAAPTSEMAGPGVVDEATGARYCFQRTPEGALLAAATIAALGEDPATQEAMGEHLVSSEGPGRAAYLERVRGGAAAAPTRLQIAGFNVLEYDGTEAAIDLAFTTSSNAVGAVLLPLVWENGDWKVRLSDDGQLPNPPVQLPNLAGYITWAGV